jgi:hypothetical protein
LDFRRKGDGRERAGGNSSGVEGKLSELLIFQTGGESAVLSVDLLGNGADLDRLGLTGD